MENLILVDSRNRAIGRAEKFAVHAQGLRHRAFSIFLVDPRGRVLLQQRNPRKYHSGGLWANSCCGHPRPGERTLAAARRRLGEELGVTVPLHFGFFTRYSAVVSNDLTENEIVHVYFGSLPKTLHPDPREVVATDRRTLVDLRRDIRRHPEQYAFWLKHYVAHDWQALQRCVAAERARGERTPSPGNRRATQTDSAAAAT